ncbi:hypothetical protein TRIUR3_22683 [Triticum urartu]|uniref:Uncharacterized protein n=1 Tax=Triticum urartu TaxID=4572 RepID=M8AJP6_TRIUA|nr:hypothetical protein TRIUR3_22683 [Triticum urartu]
MSRSPTRAASSLAWPLSPFRLPEPMPRSSLLIHRGILRLRREVRADLSSTEWLCRLISSRSRRLRAPCGDVVLYMLGVGGCGTDTVDDKELHLVHHRDGQCHIKSFISVSVIPLVTKQSDTRRNWQPRWLHLDIGPPMDRIGVGQCRFDGRRRLRIGKKKTTEAAQELVWVG